MRLSKEPVSNCNQSSDEALDNRESAAPAGHCDAAPTLFQTCVGGLTRDVVTDEPMQHFIELVHGQTHRLLHVARRYLDEDEAHDAVQEAFIRAYEHRDSFRGAARLSTWLHRIVVNCCISRLRKAHVSREFSIEALSLDSTDSELHIDQDGIDPERYAENQELQLLCRQSIQQLPATFRNVLMLRDVEGFTGKETARLLGISVSLVKVRLHRARKTLREALSPYLR